MGKEDGLVVCLQQFCAEARAIAVQTGVLGFVRCTALETAVKPVGTTHNGDSSCCVMRCVVASSSIYGVSVCRTLSRTYVEIRIVWRAANNVPPPQLNRFLSRSFYKRVHPGGYNERTATVDRQKQRAGTGWALVGG